MSTLIFKAIATACILLATIIANAQNSKPLAISETHIIDGKTATITRKSSTEVNHSAILEFVSDCENHVKSRKKLTIVPVRGGVAQMKMVDSYYTRCAVRGNIDVLSPGEYLITSVEMTDDEYTVVEVYNALEKKVSESIITYKNRNTMRKLSVPENGYVKVSISKVSAIKPVAID